MSKRWGTLASCLLLLAFLLASCYLVAGERIDTVPFTETQPGVYTVNFVSADGQAYRSLETGLPAASVVVEITAHTEQGEVTVVALSLDGSPEITVTARFGLEGQGRGVVRTDDTGKITFRVTALEARSGTYTLRYRLAVPPTPTPTSPPTPAP